MTGLNYRQPPALTYEHSELIQKYRYEYDYRYLVRYPELCQKKLGLSEEIVSKLPEEIDRTRDNIIDWMTRYLTYEQLLFVGW